MHRGQATVEYLTLLAFASILVAALLALARGGPALSRAVGRAITPGLGHARTVHTADERALANPRLAALVARALPALVLERDRWGDDDEVPVDDACQQAACARYGGAEPVLYVHLSQRRRGPVVELWTYYPDSRTDHVPVPALQGYHRDDWEGLLVAFDSSGALLGARATAHAGFNGSTPWRDQTSEDWAPYSGVPYPASGSPALAP